MDEFTKFILKHEEHDPGKLLLARGRYPGIDMALAASTLLGRRKMKTKVPEWYSHPSLIYPTRLATEQCSSGATSRYKAQLAFRICRERKAGIREGFAIADLTGGLGVDAWAFSELFARVLYNDADAVLASAAKHNFKELNINNITISCNKVVKDNNNFVTFKDKLTDFQPDILFLDPARRDEAGKKVFLLEDCSPNLLELQDDLLGVCPEILVKLSPMADVSMLLRRIAAAPGKASVKELHVLSAGGECKELLLWISRGHAGPVRTVVCEEGAILDDGGLPVPKEPGLAAREELFSLPFLFEPGKAVSKARFGGLLCERFSMVKAGTMTNLYFCAGADETLLKYGKLFKVLEVLPLSGRSLREAGKKYPGAEATARNIPMTSEQLKSRLGSRGGSGGTHVFAFRADWPGGGDNYLLAGSRLTSLPEDI